MKGKTQITLEAHASIYLEYEALLGGDVVTPYQGISSSIHFRSDQASLLWDKYFDIVGFIHDHLNLSNDKVKKMGVKHWLNMEESYPPKSGDVWLIWPYKKVGVYSEDKVGNGEIKLWLE